MHRSQVPSRFLPLFDKIYRVCEGIFSELENRNYLRKGLSHEDRLKLLYIWKRTKSSAQALNYLDTLFHPKNPDQKMQIDNLSKGGMMKEHLTSLWAQSMISNFLASIESMFRFTLVFFLNQKFFRDMKSDPKHMTANRLLEKLTDISAQAEDLDEAFDLDLRNSIAHGAFWFDRGKLHYTSDPHLRKTGQLSLPELRETVRKANIGAFAFIDVLHEEIRKGTFYANDLP